MNQFGFDFSTILENINLDEISLSDIVQLIDGLSTDEVVGNNLSSAFSDDSITYLYSGKIEASGEFISSSIIANAFDNSRTIDKTVVGYFLFDQNQSFRPLLEIAIENDIRNGKIKDVFDYVKEGFDKNSIAYITLESLSMETNLGDAEIVSAAKMAVDGFIYEPSKGAWAIASENFIEATPVNSKIECIIPDDVNLDRTWAVVEVPTALDKLPDKMIIGNFTVAELKVLCDTNGLTAVQEKLKNSSVDFTDTILTDNTRLYYDKEGLIIDIELPNNSAGITGDPSVFNTTIGEIKSYASDAVMSSKYLDYSSLKPLEQLQAKKGNDLYTKLGIDPARTSFSDPDLATHLALVGSDPDIINQSTIYFDSTGKIAAIDVSQTTGGSPLPSQGSYTASASVDEWSKLTKDSDIHKYDGFDSLSDLDKYYAKKGIDLYQKNGFDISDAAKSNQASLSSHLSDIGRTQSIADDITFHYSGDGKITGIDLPGTGASSVSDSAFSAKLGEMKSYADDINMKGYFGVDYDNFTAVEKNQARQLVYNVDKIADSSRAPVWDDALESYLRATGKTVDQLDQLDNIAISIGKKIASNSPDISDMAKLMKKYDKIAKIGSKVGGVVDFVFMADIGIAC